MWVLRQNGSALSKRDWGTFVAVSNDEHERTLAIAEIALGQIRSLAQTASPRNFEIWYHYATGYNPNLNQTINDTLAKNGTLSEADLDLIYKKHIAPTRASDHLGTLGPRVLDEIKQVMATIDTATGSATTYSLRLADARKELERASDEDAIRAVVEHLVKGTEEMARSNRRLEARLAASRQEIEELHQDLKTARTESLTDPLTTLSNRKFFDMALAKAIAEARESNEPLSLLIVDIDRFKSFNDKYGHLTGDQVLRLVALSMKQNVKGQDIAARYGGDEFVIALPNTALQPAIVVADHIRRAVISKELVKRSSGERLGRVTISIGVAMLCAQDTSQTLIERADGCLYAAKHRGRNHVICETDLEADGAAKSGAPMRVA